jgi:hypothetical protein
MAKGRSQEDFWRPMLTGQMPGLLAAKRCSSAFLRSPVASSAWRRSGTPASSACASSGEAPSALNRRICKWYLVSATSASAARLDTSALERRTLALRRRAAAVEAWVEWLAPAAAPA